MKKAIALILIALCPLTVLILIQNDLAERQSAYSKARERLESALNTTMSRQKNINQELSQNSALQQNLSMQMFGAVGRILAGYAQHGKIDRLLVVDEQCRIVAQSEQGVSLQKDCPIPDLQRTSHEEFVWIKTTDGLSMSLVSPLPLPEGGTFYLKTTTLLGDSWLNTFPELTQLRRELGFSFQTKAPWISRSLWQAGPEASTRLTVYAHDGWFLLFPQLLAKPQLDLGKAWFLSLSLFFLSVSYLLLSLKKRQESLDSTLQKLREWSTDLGTEPSDKSLDQNPLESLKTAMSRLVKRNLENQARLEHQAKLLQQQIVKLESRVIEQQGEQAWFQHTQSLHQQMQACAEAYIAKLQESISLGEDLSYVASREIFKPAQRLFDLSSRWDMELSKHSPKKFLRTLTERVNEQGSSELEDSLDRLIQDSHNVGNCAINLSMLSQKLNQELKATLSLAQHWQSMMHNGSRDQQSLLGILQESQTLIKLRGEALPLSYDNLMGGEARLEGIEIPTSTVTSVLYHAHLALIETALDKGARQLHLSTHIKKRKDRHILVVSLRSEGQDQLEPGSDLPAKASQHLSLAIQLLQGYAMKITSLPPLPGVYALALIWHPECPSEIPPLGVDLRLDNSSSFSHMDEMEKL